MMLPTLESNQTKTVEVLIKDNPNQNSPERTPKPGGKRNRLPKEIEE